MMLSPTENFATSQTKNRKPSNSAMRDEAFGKRFQELVKEARGPKTLQRLGPWLGVSTTMAWYYRTGENVPSMETARFIAQKLGCCVEYLLTGRGPKRPGSDLPVITERFALLKPAHQAAVAAVIESLLAAQQAEPPPDPAPEDPEPRTPARPS